MSPSRAIVVTGKGDRFLQRLETRLSQQDIAITARRPFDDRLRCDAAFRHAGLDCVDIERARRQMVDVRPLEADDVGDQPMGIVQALVGVGADGRFAMPAEGFQRLGDEFRRFRLAQAAVLLMALDQRDGARGVDPPFRQNGFGLAAQPFVLDQVQSQQRGEDAERIDVERCLFDRPEAGGMNRHAGNRKVVVADRLHAHDRKQPADGEKLVGRTEPDGAVALDIDALQLAGPGQAIAQVGILSRQPAFTSATSSISVPYCGTSARYICDIASVNSDRMRSGETKACGIGKLRLIPFLQDEPLYTRDKAANIAISEIAHSEME